MKINDHPLSFGALIKSLLLILALSSRSVFAWQTLTDDIDLTCNQVETTKVNCDYRPLTNDAVTDIEVSMDGADPYISRHTTYPEADSKIAILFLVDTSDPKRQDVVRHNIQDIKTLLSATRPHHYLGLAGFDKTLRIKAPVGSSKSHILANMDELKAEGLTTELYRSVLKAVQLLELVDADRKALYVFSDGLAEDKAYFHQDVINAARKAGVVINGIGYPRSVSLSVALQTLRRLSEETGGIFIEADTALNLPEDFVKNPFGNLDRGGKITINLDNANTLNSPEQRLTMIFTTEAGRISNNIPVKLPPTPEAGTQKSVVRQAPAAVTPPVVIETTAAPKQGLDKWLWYGVPVLLVMLLLMTLITLYLLFRTQNKKGDKIQTVEPLKPFAYLITQDEKALRYPITRTTWRIGRSRDNEMTLNDNSVSRRHAEIQRYSNGKFMIFDRDSSNGVFVNTKKINKQKLEEGDIIEIGDIYLRFTQTPSDYQLDEQTAVMNTKAPI